MKNKENNCVDPEHLALLVVTRLHVRQRVEATEIIRKAKHEDLVKELCQKFKEINLALNSRSIREELHDHFTKTIRAGVGVLTILDSEYPKQLKEIYDPPLILYYVGDLSAELLQKPMVAVVGSRQADKEGINIALEFSEALARAGICVVSGLALGIDGAAHRGAAKAENCSTISVLGNALPDIMPRTNHRVATEILASRGLILSQFEINTPVFATNFLDRNRVIAGLCRGTLVVQAIERSGSLVTARFSNESGREVFVVPGSIKNHRYKGSHKLIRDGATIVTHAKEIIEILQESDRTLFNNQGQNQEVGSIKSNGKIKTHNPITKILYRHGEMSIEELKQKLNNPTNFATEMLELELNDEITRLPGNRVGLVS